MLLVDLRRRIADGTIVATPIRTMVNHETNELAIANLRVPVENRIGDEHKGFKVILSGMNSERVIVTSEYIGAGFHLLDRAIQYANEREVFGRPIGQNQGIQFPIAQAYANLQAASLMRWRAAEMYVGGENPRFEVNAAKLLASQALWQAAAGRLRHLRRLRGGRGVRDRAQVARGAPAVHGADLQQPGARRHRPRHPRPAEVLLGGDGSG